MAEQGILNVKKEVENKEKKLSTKYMYDNEWTKKQCSLFELDQNDSSVPFFTEISDGYILPRKESEKYWGNGGVLSSDGDYVVESGLTHVFGGKYDVDLENVKRIDECVYYIPIIPKHWGHFLVEVICRFWFAVDEKYSDNTFKIAFCGVGWRDEKITGNYLELFRYLGIDQDRLLYVKEVLKFRKILIPSYTMSFYEKYNPYYKKIVSRIKTNALKESENDNKQKSEYIYFTRLNLKEARQNEVGEYEIMKAFKNNGFKILSPEQMSLEDQVFYISNCKIMASVSGTIPHNAIFLNEGAKLWILNRTCMPNHPQLMINKLFDLDFNIIDVYSKKHIRNPQNYGEGPFEIGVSDELKTVFEDYGFAAPESSIMVSINNDFKLQLLKLLMICRKNKYILDIWHRIKKTY